MKRGQRLSVIILLFVLIAAGLGPGRPSLAATSKSGSSNQGSGGIVKVDRIDRTMGQVELIGQVDARVNGLTAEQQSSLEEMKLATNNLQITLNDLNGTPTFIFGRFKLDPTRSGRFVRAGAAAFALPSQSQTHLALAETFFAEYKELLQLNDPVRELRLRDYQSDELGSKHLKFEQTYRGVPVWASEVILHLNANDEVYALNGRYEPTPTRIVTTEAQVPSARAVEIAANDLAARVRVEPLSPAAAELLNYSGPTAEKVIFPMRRSGEPRLAWIVNVRPNFVQNWYTFVDAQTGDVLFKYNATAADGAANGQGTDLNGRQQQLKVYQAGPSFFLIDITRSIFNAQQSQLPNNPVGAIWTVDARNKDLDRNVSIFHVTSPTTTFDDRSSVSAHFNGGVVFEYFKNTHGRNAIDGQGSTIISVIHVTEDGQPMDNAYWNGKAMAYGDGNQGFKPLAGGLDVAAHEMAHGVTEFTANLVYLSQSGALNESMSDVFGVMVDRDDLKIGEDVVKPEVFSTGALRDMENPNQGLQRGQRGWQPASMSQYVQLPETEDGDNGGVHVNSGIPNRAAALIIRAIGRDKAERIYYRALSTYLTRNSQFTDARVAVVQAAGDLFGRQSAEVTAANQAFDQVGVSGGTTPPPPPPPTVTGTNFITYVRPDYTIGIIKPDGSSKIELTNMTGRVRHSTDGGDIAKLSVSRDGKTVWFTRDDGLVGFLDISNLNNILEFRLPNLRIQTTGDIANAAARPDATFSAASGSVSGAVALTSKNRPDPNVYIVDFTAGTMTTLPLRNQTTGQGVDSNTIAYADVIDWFADGSVIIYDALNQVNQASGTPIEYWAFNLLRPATKDNLSALPPQPAGISVGNPQFGSVTQTLVAYNEFDDRTGNVKLKVIDFSQSKIFDFVDPVQQGFGALRPTFSPDDKGMAFVDVRNFNTLPFVGLLLVADLTTGVVTSLAVQAANPEWFAKPN
jgi:Zn-dependent metalloprotease